MHCQSRQRGSCRTKLEAAFLTLTAAVILITHIGAGEW